MNGLKIKESDMSIETMKLALETLEKLNKDGWILADFEDDVYASIDALRAAIEQTEQNTKTPLKVLDLTVRVECLLRRGRVYDVETLKAMDVRHLLAIPDFGKKALKEVSEALLKYELVTERRLMRKQRDQQVTTLPKRELPVITDDEIMNQWCAVMKSTEGTALPILEFAHAITAKLENA
jgi:DNA-directed RNA polymerase alpha subunit